MLNLSADMNVPSFLGKSMVLKTLKILQLWREPVEIYLSGNLFLLLGLRTIKQPFSVLEKEIEKLLRAM